LDVVDPTDGLTSLREAIARPDVDLINFDTAGAFSRPQTIELDPSLQELSITQSLKIDGAGAHVSVSGGDEVRVFLVGRNVTAQLTGLTITHGRALGITPGPDGTPTDGLGGGILNYGTLYLDNDVIADNQALGILGVDNGFPAGARGGGVQNQEGELIVTDCQFLNNLARGADGSPGSAAGLGAGGGIANGRNARSATVTDSLFVGNVAQGGGNGGGSTDNFAGLGFGGAITNSGKFTVTGSTFLRNLARGGNGNVSPLAAGGGGGGAIGSGNSAATVQVVLTVDDSTFDHNQAVGGTGNRLPAGAVAPDTSLAPNAAVGGAIQIVQGSGKITKSTFDHNLARGGQGATDSAAGNGVGGALYVGAVLSSVNKVEVIDCAADHNAAVGGPGGPGAGGAGLGGGFAVVNPLSPRRLAVLEITNTIVDHNQARGGDGGAGADGGNGFGGGLYNGRLSSLSLIGATVEYNLALGGEAGSGGLDGQGIGGGVYTLGTFSFDDTTVIKKNHASTSDDNIFGSYTIS
jgi:hypothetical protein